MITLEEARKRAKADAKTYDYYLNPDPDFLKDRLEGLKHNARASKDSAADNK